MNLTFVLLFSIVVSLTCTTTILLNKPDSNLTI